MDWKIGVPVGVLAALTLPHCIGNIDDATSEKILDLAKLVFIAAALAFAPRDIKAALQSREWQPFVLACYGPATAFVLLAAHPSYARIASICAASIWLIQRFGMELLHAHGAHPQPGPVLPPTHDQASHNTRAQLRIYERDLFRTFGIDLERPPKMRTLEQIPEGVIPGKLDNLYDNIIEEIMAFTQVRDPAEPITILHKMCASVAELVKFSCQKDLQEMPRIHNLDTLQNLTPLSVILLVLAKKMEWKEPVNEIDDLEAYNRAKHKSADLQALAQVAHRLLIASIAHQIAYEAYLIAKPDDNPQENASTEGSAAAVPSARKVNRITVIMISRGASRISKLTDPLSGVEENLWFPRDRDSVGNTYTEFANIIEKVTREAHQQLNHFEPESDLEAKKLMEGLVALMDELQRHVSRMGGSTKRARVSSGPVSGAAAAAGAGKAEED